jgi:hypothetical protein
MDCGYTIPGEICMAAAALLASRGAGSPDIQQTFANVEIFMKP